MRVPQVSERIKEAPAQALRGVFAGIGQLLLITDKLRNKAPASQQVPQARPPEASETVPPAASVPADAPKSDKADKWQRWIAALRSRDPKAPSSSCSCGRSRTCARARKPTPPLRRRT